MREKRAGKVKLPEALEIVTKPSSKGCLKASRAVRLNSGISSKKRTPLWARLTSPGFTFVPPPIREASEALLWGALKGRFVTGISSVSLPHSADWPPM